MADDKPVRPVTERQESFAKKQVERAKSLSSGEPGRSGPPDRHGMPKLPPGQRAVTNWPVLDLGVLPRIDLEEWRLDVDGLVEQPFTLTWKEFLELPQSDDVSDFHCVTTWSQMDLRWRGVRFRDLMARPAPPAEAAYVLTTGSAVDPSARQPHPTHPP